MYESILTIYRHIILSGFTLTMFLIFAGNGWGLLSNMYLNCVLNLQSYFSKDGVVLQNIKKSQPASKMCLFGKHKCTYNPINEIIDDNDSETGGSTISSCGAEKFDASTLSDTSSVGFCTGIAVPGAGILNGQWVLSNPFEWNLELVRDGIESIIQDDISEIFIQSSVYRNAEPKSLRNLFFNFRRERKRRHHIQQQKKKNLHPLSQVPENSPLILETNKNKEQTLNAENLIKRNFFEEDYEEDLPPLKFRPFLRAGILLLFSRCFRIGILFPIRFLILLSSFVYLFTVSFLSCFITFSDQTKTKISIYYCRIFNAGTSLIARYHNLEHRPIRPGVAVANHLSPNDIQIICANVEKNRDYLYMVTGQKHKGIIWAVESLVEKFCPSIWLERKDANERKKFTDVVLNMAKKAGPILIFPEGYCTNNQKVLQFRRAVFDKDIIIYPIAIRQDARFGDSYWSENHFILYLWRIITSWAIVYDVFYLPAQTRLLNEDSTQFAARIQRLIADTINVKCANFDAGLFYKESEREKYRKIWMEECAKRIKAIINYNITKISPKTNASKSDNEEKCKKNNNFTTPSESGSDEMLSLSTNEIEDYIISSSESENFDGQDAEISEELKQKLNKKKFDELIIDEPLETKSQNFCQRKSTMISDKLEGFEILRRRRYNSLKIIGRQVLIEDVLNG